jgi:hypothetical protein
MTDRPIIFSAPMIRALLDGRKTQTRRIYRVPPGSYVEQGRIWAMTDGCPHGDAALPYAPGDRLWCKEVWGLGISDHGDCPRYKATLDYMCGDKIVSPHEGPFAWKSPRFMPKRFSRLTLLVTDVRVQRLQEISSADAIAEGCPPYANSATIDCDTPNPRDDFKRLWNGIHGPDAWDANPWVAAITFDVKHGNIDDLTGGGE